MEETRDRHLRYLRAVNSPIRRDILRAMKDGNNTIETLSSVTSLDEKTLDWHLKILEHGFCVEAKTVDSKKVFELTQEGLVVDYTDQ
jgi:DNA-binding transcriptional ArsR family regulator